MKRIGLGFLVVLLSGVGVWTASARVDVPGGLTVCLGEDAAQHTTKSWRAPGRIIQCLETDAGKVSDIRGEICSAGVYGKVTARTFDGETLPFIDGSVNWIVSGNRCGVSRDEMLRVLAPGGQVFFTDGREIVFDKPVSRNLDDWSHYHHNPAGTMVGRDTVVGPPRRIQWMGHPKWLRNHDFMSSMHAMVSCGGRIFYIIDEGLRKHIFLPADWKLVARDAYNGTILWKQQLKDWQPNNWPLKSGPGDMPRRIVATDDVVYATAGLIEPVTAFDAETGRILRTYKGTDATVEIIHSDGILFLLTDPKKTPPGYKAASSGYGEIKRAEQQWAWTPESNERKIVAVNAETGKILWQHAAKAAPLSLTVSPSQVFFHNGTSMVCLKRRTGEKAWESDPVPIKSVPTGGSLRVAYSDGVLVFALGVSMTAFDAKNGSALWKEKLQKTSHHCPEDLFIIKGKIWSPKTGKPQQNGTPYKVIDLKTGNIDKEFVAENIKGFPMHPRCYPSRATERFIMTNGMGTEFYEVGGTKVDVNNTVRGSCIYGVMPANGLLYKPPDTCACYYQSKLEWLCALAPASAKATAGKPASRLEKGPAFGRVISDQSSVISDQSDWPMYRRTTDRGGYNPATVSSNVKSGWNVKLGGKLTQPIVVDGKVFVAAVEKQTLYALDEESGKELWQFTADGRIDSAPTVYKGSVIFGSADGRVYCLRASDGALAWRYLVAHNDRQIIAFQQPESVWPVSGTVLINKDIAYCLAGRNMFFDGGLRLVMLNPSTGKLLGENILDENDPRTGKNLQTLIEAKYMPVANADVLTTDGEQLYMQTQSFTLEGKRNELAPIQPGKQEPGGEHLFCQTGLLDDIWYHRSYWIYGNNCGEGWAAYNKPRGFAPAGRILCFDDTLAYGFRSEPLGNILHARTTYKLYAADKVPGQSTPERVQTKIKGKKNRQAAGVKPGGGKAGSLIPSRWERESIGLFANAMALTGKTLFVAGPPDIADETKMLGYEVGVDSEINKELARQDEAWRGKMGGLLQVVDARSGDKLAEQKLDTYPVFDGMSAANGKLFMSMKDGTVRCFR